MTREQLRQALKDHNVLAFLRVIRESESRQTADAYRLENGGRVLPECPVDHPSKGLKSPPGKAFGAYQFLASTWAGLVKKYGFESMSPECQDEAAVALIAGRGALDEVMVGDLDGAFMLLEKEWTSLPGGAEENSATKRARDVFVKWGGKPKSAAPEFNPDSLDTEKYNETVHESTVKPEVPRMAPIILPLLSIAAQFIPQLAEKFSSGSEVANRNLAAGKVLAEAITAATNSPNLQAAVEKMQADPEAVRAAKVAVAQEWPELFEVAGGITEARKLMHTDGPWWHQFASLPFAVIVMLMPIIYFVIYEVITGTVWTLEIRASVVSAVISGVLFAIVGFALGTSYGSQRKTNILANKE